MASNIIPFGKYRGHTVADVTVIDPQYADWLAAQAWFAAKFASHYEEMRGRASADADTPEHNRLQARFFDAEFILKVYAATSGLHRYYWELTEEADKYVTQDRWGALRRAQRGPLALDGAWCRKRTAQRRALAPRLYTSDNFKAWLDMHRKEICAQITVTPEDIADISMRYSYHDPCYIELKPAIGDDYPAVIRQIRGQMDRARLQRREGAFYVFYKEFTASGVDEPMLERMFEAAGITPYRFDLIDELFERMGELIWSAPSKWADK